MEGDAVDHVAQRQGSLAQVVDLELATLTGQAQALFQRCVDLRVDRLLQRRRQQRHAVAFRHQQAVQGDGFGLDGVGQQSHGQIMQGRADRLLGQGVRKHRCPHLVQFILEHRGQQAFLVAEQLVRRARRAAGLPQDALDGGLRVSMFQQRLRRRFKQPQAPGLALACQRARRRFHGIGHLGSPLLLLRVFLSSNNVASCRYVM
ncbi:hypothetical protein D3C85_1330240 [compost metagenome]